MLRLVRVFALVGGVAVVTVAMSASAAHVSTGWAGLARGSNQDACLDTGQAAVEAAGFRASISDDRQTVFGWRGEESLTVRCIADRGLAVVFAWVTDANNDSGNLVNGVLAAYRGGSAPTQPRQQPGVKG